MVDTKQQQQQASNQPPPTKDHYSYSYTYKTAGDPQSGMPSVNTVEVNESVTEEIGPDGSKIIRRHQQEKQINKITQVVTQRVIKRQYIDPNTGQIIEYDPNNELFANLPPETVFEEHTIISDDSNGQPPVVTTTTMSKTNQASNLVGHMNNLNLQENNDCLDNVTNVYNILKQQQQQQTGGNVFKIKSHPEDNQGYPEEKNMDYDPDDSYPDDDSPYEGLIQTQDDDLNANNNKSNRRKGKKKGLVNDLIDNEQLLNSAGSSSAGSSSSPILFESNANDMPFVANVYQSKKYRGGDQGHSTYATVLPSSNIMQSNTPRSGYSNNYATVSQHHYQSSTKYTSTQQQQQQQLSIDPYATLNGQQGGQQHSHRSQLSIYQQNKHLQHMHQQQASPSMNNEYG